jgi:protein ImuB
MGTRIACLLVSDLPLRAELRAHPELTELPMVVASGPDARADIIALSPAARAAGVQSWSSVAQARAACPAIHVRVASPALERAGRDALLDIALSLSPRAILKPRSTGLFASEGCVFLDASGVSALFHSERGFASALAARAEAQGLPGVVALAGSQTVSLLVTRRLAGRPGTIQVLAPGTESAFLAPLSLDLLDPDDRVAQALTRLGVHTVRDLLKLPRRALAQRLGPEMLGLVARARGEAMESPLPEPTHTRIEEAIDLESPIVSLEPLSFVLRGLISRLTERLALRARACGGLDLELLLEGGGRDARRVGLAAPTLDIRVMLRLCMLALTERPPDCAIESLSIGTEGIPGRSDQLDLFRPRGPDPAALGRTLSELEALCGEGRVGSPEVPDTHHPGAFGLRPFHPPGAEAPARSSSHRHAGSRAAPRSCAKGESSGPDRDETLAGHVPPSLPAIRALRPPVSAEVRVDRGQPSFIRSAVTNGHVVVAAGPWRTTGNWWSEQERFALDHFDVQVSDGIVVRLCFDWLHRVWQIDGIYD